MEAYCPPVGVVDERTLGRVSRLQRLIKGSDGDRGIKALPQGPANSLAREGIEDHCQIDEGPGQMHIGDVRHPDLVGG